MFKIEFDETNPLILSAVVTMLNTVNGETPPVAVTKVGETITVGNKSITNTVETPITDDGLDSNGYPWDARIHAKTKTKNADDTWKILRRPVKAFETPEAWDEFIASVRAETVPTSETTNVPPPSEATTEEVVPPPNAFGTPPSEATTEEVAPPETMTFPVLMKLVTGSKGKITQEDFQEVCDAYEITKPSDLAKKENKILLSAIYEELETILSE